MVASQEPNSTTEASVTIVKLEAIPQLPHPGPGLNMSDLERRPRTNDDLTEEPYQRLKSDFGNFDDYSDAEGGAVRYLQCGLGLVTFVLLILLL